MKRYLIKWQERTQSSFLNWNKIGFRNRLETVHKADRRNSPRMVHSGWGLDQYPKPHLNTMAHAGIDTILVFVEDVDKTPSGYQLGMAPEEEWLRLIRSLLTDVILQATFEMFEDFEVVV